MIYDVFVHSDMIGRIKSVENVRQVNANNQAKRVLNFVIQCKDVVQVPMTVWDDEIDRWASILTKG